MKLINFKYNGIKESIIQHCLNLLKRPDVKDELKAVMRPVIDMLLRQITPYIYLSITFVFISFLLILGIFILLLRNKFTFKHS